VLRANGAHWPYLITVFAVACSGQTAVPNTPDYAALRSGVDSAANRLLTALRADASDSLLALMADDVVVMPPNEAVLRGKAAVRAWYQQFLTQWRTSSLTVTDREVLIGGDWATEVAGFEWTLVPVAGGPPVIDHGSYIQAWHREPNGRWLFSREVWNSKAAPREPGRQR
jgi:ketosteroid isomerase-like protein